MGEPSRRAEKLACSGSEDTWSSRCLTEYPAVGLRRPEAVEQPEGPHPVQGRRVPGRQVECRLREAPAGADLRPEAAPQAGRSYWLVFHPVASSSGWHLGIQAPRRQTPARQGPGLARCPSPASSPVATPPGCWPRGSPARTENTERHRAYICPRAKSCRRIPPGSRPKARSRPLPAPTKAPRVASWTLAAISCGANPLFPPSLASSAVPQTQR